MNNRLLSIFAFLGALAFAVTSCSEEDVIQNSPPFKNELSINGTPQQQVVVGCTQGTNFSIYASFENGAKKGSIGLTFASPTMPTVGTYTLVHTPPHTGQVRMHIVPDITDPATNFIADAGQLITIAIIEGSPVATIGNITMSSDSGSASLVVNGRLGCYNFTGNPGAINIPNNTLTIDADSTLTLSQACSTAANFYTIMGTATDSGTSTSAIFLFPGTAAPTPGTYTLVSSAAPQAGQVTFTIAEGATQYQASSGEVFVTLVGGGPKVSFSGITLKQVNATTTINATGSITCNPVSTTGGSTTTGSTSGSTTSGTTTSGSTSGSTTTYVNTGSTATLGTNSPQSLMTACNAMGSYQTIGQSATLNVAFKFYGSNSISAGNYALVSAGTVLQPGQASLKVVSDSLTYNPTGGEATLMLVGGVPKVTFNSIPVTHMGTDTINTTISGTLICP